MLTQDMYEIHDKNKTIAQSPEYEQSQFRAHISVTPHVTFAVLTFLRMWH